MLVKHGRRAEAARHALSLIDDTRVIPWYVKAIKTDSYSLKFNALDRLSRLEGDEALEGLMIGMTTQGKDIGNCTTPAVAESSAVNIRHMAVSALARRPHPKAKALFLSMQDDPAIAVRIKVIQAAAKMKTPESQALLERHTHDPDAMVRDEAVRLLELLKNDSVK